MVRVRLSRFDIHRLLTCVVLTDADLEIAVRQIGQTRSDTSLVFGLIVRGSRRTRSLRCRDNLPIVFVKLELE